MELVMQAERFDDCDEPIGAEEIRIADYSGPEDYIVVMFDGGVYRVKKSDVVLLAKILSQT